MKLIVVVALFCFSSLFAQTKAIIFGDVKSNENVNLIGASISTKTNNQHFYSISDTLGRFSEKLPIRIN